MAKKRYTVEANYPAEPSEGDEKSYAIIDHIKPADDPKRKPKIIAVVYDFADAQNICDYLNLLNKTTERLLMQLDMDVFEEYFDEAGLKIVPKE